MRMRHATLTLLLALVGACGIGSAGITTEPTQVPQRLQLFLLAGQSNMAGRGVVEAQDLVVHPHVLMLDRALHWVPAVEPLHFDKPNAGVGPGRSFGIAVAAANSSEQIGLIPTAVGGSPISSWVPGALDAATRTHPYDEAIVRARAAMQAGELKAILWHQGESDCNPRASIGYAARLRAVIEQFRTDLGNQRLPFLIGQLGRFDGKPWDDATLRVDSAQRALAAEMPNVVFVSAAGLKDRGDTLHFSAEAAREFGRRYAEAYLRFIKK
jgi:hypothetical protein